MSTEQFAHSDLQPLSRYIGGLCAGCTALILRGEPAVRLHGKVFHLGCADYRDELERTRSAVEGKRTVG
jgi:hypothetical protein